MLRGTFPGHRRYSITHRAVQRLRELVPTMDEQDDESLRDRLDSALGRAEDGGKAVRTLDAMLGEPQVLIPVEEFGEQLFAIIKEDTVVTVLPQGHGQEILQRGQALQERVASGEVKVEREAAPAATSDRWDANGGGAQVRRRWRRESPSPVVIERPSRQGAAEAPAPAEASAPISDVVELDRQEDKERPSDPVEAALFDALEKGSRRAAVAALSEILRDEDRDGELLPVWNDLASQGIPRTLRLGDLIDACRQV